MAEPSDVFWSRCEAGGCIGIQLVPGRMCLAHASSSDRDAALSQLNQTGRIDARGVQIGDLLLEQVLAAAPRGSNGRVIFRAARFDRAIFDGVARFRGATFDGEARFTGVTFTSAAVFDEATFTGHAWFDEATFTGVAGFCNAIFDGEARFTGVTFTSAAQFAGVAFNFAMFVKATFTGVGWFDHAVFTDEAWFDDATFARDALFRGVIVTKDALFSGATFAGSADFREATFRGPVMLDRVRLDQARELGPVLAYRGLVLDDSQFAQPIQIEVSTTGICCRRARFQGGVHFRLRWARVTLDDTDFLAPSILTGVPRLASEELAEREMVIARAWRRLLAGEISERPQVLSMRRTNVAGLGLSNVTVADCRFAGAHNLDKLRPETNVSFGVAPAPLGRLNWDRRQVIAEEADWRAGRTRSWGWAATCWPEWLGDRPSVLDPGQIAGLYRALRKGREDTKDEPGAADFYHGEMEMRRARPIIGSRATNASSGRAERGLLTAYWLASGYSLRAWRAAAWLAAVTGVFAVAFHLVGFAVQPRSASYWTSLLYAFRATLSLTDNQVKLTAWGMFLQGLLRITGPLLLGLAVLALRGRVKR